MADRSDAMAADLFWLCAIVQLFVSMRFLLRVRQLERPHVTPAVIRLAAGQRKDSWLASGLIWGMILCKSSPYGDALFVAGSIGLVWLIGRACQRNNLVGKARFE